MSETTNQDYLEEEQSDLIKQYHKDYDVTMFLPDLISDIYSQKKEFNKIVSLSDLIEIMKESFEKHLTYLSQHKIDFIEFAQKFQNDLLEENKTDLYPEFRKLLNELAYSYELLQPNK